MGNLTEKCQWEISQEYLSKQRLGQIKIRRLSLNALSRRRRRKLKKELRHRRHMRNKLERFKKHLMMKRNYVSLLSSKRLKMKSLKLNCRMIKLKKLKKIYLIVKIGFKDNSKT
jgi:hypothetical protein